MMIFVSVRVVPVYCPSQEAIRELCLAAQSLDIVLCSHYCALLRGPYFWYSQYSLGEMKSCPKRRNVAIGARAFRAGFGD